MLSDRNLIFLISQPRAGSTLLQRILGNHPEIHTVSEPWLMLHPLSAFRTQGYTADYNSDLATGAVKDFLQTFPDGENAYVEGLRRMYCYLYDCALSHSNKNYFLDKTPRYYQIIPELCQTFPKANFIILLRNPLAVFCSILRTWIQEDWFQLHWFREDLIQGPILLIQGIESLPHNSITVRYENFLQTPEPQMEKICHTLGIEFFPEILNYAKAELPSWTLGDPESIYQNAKPNLAHSDRWIEEIENPQVWRLVWEYLDLLGREQVRQMGYSDEELHNLMERYRPSPFALWNTFPLAWLLKKPNERKKWEYERLFLKLANSLRRRGLLGTIARTIEKGLKPRES